MEGILDAMPRSRRSWPSMIHRLLFDLLTLAGFVIHYNRGRPHASLGPGISDPLSELNQLVSTGHHLPEHAQVIASPILGGLHHEYRLARDAA